MKTSVLLLAAALAASGLAAEQPAKTPAETVAAFHAALARNDQEGALALLAPEVIVFESGGAEMSRDEYRAQHLGADAEFSKSTTREVVDQKTGEAGEAAWVLTRTRTSGSFRGRSVRAEGVETMLLRRSPEGWRIVHIHWSSS